MFGYVQLTREFSTKKYKIGTSVHFYFFPNRLKLHNQIICNQNFEKYISIYSATTSAEDWTLNQMFKPETKTNKINAHKKYGLKCKFSPDSKFLVTTSADHTAKLWDTSNQEYISVRFLVLN